MTAVDAFLHEDEHLLLHTRAHTVFLVKAVVRAVVTVALLAAAVGLLLVEGRGHLAVSASVVLAGVLAVWGVLMLVRSVWEWDHTVLAITDEQVLVISGGLRRRARTVPLSTVERADVRQSILGRVCGYGTIVLEKDDHRRSRISYVPQPGRVSAVIASHVRRHDRAA